MKLEIDQFFLNQVSNAILIFDHAMNLIFFNQAVASREKVKFGENLMDLPLPECMKQKIWQNFGSSQSSHHSIFSCDCCGPEYGVKNERCAMVCFPNYNEQGGLHYLMVILQSGQYSLGKSCHIPEASQVIYAGIPDKSHFLEWVKRLFPVGVSTHLPFILSLIRICDYTHLAKIFDITEMAKLHQWIASHLRTILGPHDLLALYEPGCFVMVIPGESDTDAHFFRMHEAIKSVARFGYIYNKSVHQVVLQAGITVSPQDGKELDTLLFKAQHAIEQKGADDVLYCLFGQPEINARYRKQILIAHYLVTALSNNELYVVYQPKVNLLSGKIIGAEALIRWHNTELGEIPPSIFIPMAESANLIDDIGRFVMHTACRQLAQWINAGISPFVMSFNLSAVQLKNPAVLDEIQACIAEYAIPSGVLEVEITESILVEKFESAYHLSQGLRATGVRLALDDFGTGYSSLNYLSKFSVDTLKIDRSFVRDITNNPINASIANATIALAHSLDIKVVAEGVEDTAQMELLRRNKCDEIQGFLVAKPMRAEAFAELVSAWPGLIEADPDLRPAILFVDDEVNILRALKRLTRKEGYQVYVANGAAEAFELMSCNKIDVVVSDQSMPGMTGTEFLEKVKVIHPKTQRIVLSGYADLETVTRAVNDGAVFKFISKPWVDEELLHVIKQAILQAGMR